MGSGPYNLAQVHRCGGCRSGTMMTRPETRPRYPQEADVVEEEAQTPEGLFCARVAKLLARASSQEGRVCLPPAPLVYPTERKFQI